MGNPKGQADATFLLIGDGKSSINECRGQCTLCVMFVDDIPWCTFYQKKPDSLTHCTFCKVQKVVIVEG